MLYADDIVFYRNTLLSLPSHRPVYCPSFVLAASPRLPLAARWAAVSGTVELIFTCLTPKTAVRPPCSSLIIHIQARASWQVCWSHSMFCDLDNTFSLCGQKNAEAIKLLQAGLVRLNWGRSCELFWGSFCLIPDKSACQCGSRWKKKIKIQQTEE